MPTFRFWHVITAIAVGQLLGIWLAYFLRGL